MTLAADHKIMIGWPGMNIYPLADQFNVSLIKYLVWSYQLRRLIAHLEPDILHAHRVSVAGWLAASINFHPLVITPWGSDLYQHPERSLIAKWLAKFVLGRADLVTADSRDLCQQAIRYGANPKYTHLINWGVNLDVFMPGEKPIDMLNMLKILTGPIILSPRAVKPIYNLDMIVRTIPTIRNQFPNVVYIFRDYNTDPKYKLHIDNLINELDVSKSVRWLERIEPWELNADVYRLADLAISIASSDGTPGSVLEAFACGVPVIASDLPSLREWIKDGHNGYLVSPRNSDDLESALLKLLNHPEKINQFRNMNLSLVRQKADQDIEMHKMDKLYRKLL